MFLDCRASYNLDVIQYNVFVGDSAPEVYGCVSAAVTQQCGEEIASHIVEMGMKMHAACHQSGQRKRSK